MDLSVSESQPTASHSEKPAVTRPRTKSTVKRTNSTRQAKRKGVIPSEPESVLLHKATPDTRNHTGGDGSASDYSQAVDPSTPVVKGKAPRLSRQGTRSSARLRGQTSMITHEPTPTEPKIKQAKRKRESDDEGNVIGPPMKRDKGADDQTDAPVQANGTTTSDTLPDDLVLNDSNVTISHEQRADVVAEGNALGGPSKGEPPRPRGFFLRLEDLRVVFGLGGSGS